MSTDLTLDLERLAQLDEHIAEGEVRLTELIQRADELRESGGNVHAISNAIAVLDKMLTEWRSQRVTVSQRVEDLKRR